VEIFASDIPRKGLTKGASADLPCSKEKKNAYGRCRIYSLVFRQSFIKQQSVLEHWPFDRPKHGVFPSAI